MKEMIENFDLFFQTIDTIMKITKPTLSFFIDKHKTKKIKNKIDNFHFDESDEKKLNILVKKVSEDLKEELGKKFDDLKKENISELFDKDYKENLSNKIIENNRNSKEFKSVIGGEIKNENELKDIIKKYIDSYIDVFIEYYKNKSDANGYTVQIMELIKNASIDNDEKMDEIKKLIIEKNIKIDRQNLLEIRDLPFEIKDISDKCECNSGEFKYSIHFKLSNKNYKVVPEALFVTVESPTELYAFGNKSYFWGNDNKTEQNILIEFGMNGLRKLKSYGAVIFLKIYNWQRYYVRIFGREGNLYYELLSEDDYKKLKNTCETLYNKATKIDSAYEDCLKCNLFINYCDFIGK